MSGNRGAKGSIKDRLISMLYRFRYKKKELKESDYTVPNKKQQVNYLNSLTSFKEKENINILDSKDQKKLDEVKFNANFKVGNNEKELELKLDSIEYKSSELDVPTNIKKEVKKTKEEITILEEVNKFIKISNESILSIKSTIAELKEESKIKNKDTKNTEEKYIELKNKVEKLNNQIKTIKEKYDLSEFSIIESMKLINSINNYKSLADLNEMDMLLNVCKNEINKIKGVKVIYENQKKIGSNIEDAKKEHSEIKIKFIKSKEDVESINYIKEEIESEIRYQQEVVDDMYEKASRLEKEITKKIEVIGHRKILSSLFRIAGGIITIPFTGKNLFGIALGHTMINKGLKEMNRKLETRERIVINYKYEDISNKINEVKDKIEYINLVLSDSLNEISKLKTNFIEKFKNYDNVLPDYNSILEKLNNLESNLKQQQNKILSVDKKLEKEKEMNKQKLKKIDKD